MRLLEGLAREAAVRVLGSAPVAGRRLAAIGRADPIVVLILHRVGEPDGSAYRPLSPKRFEDLLRFANCHFSAVTFETLGEPAPKPRMILSFDDGYRDFVDVAMPLLRKHGIRANQNVVPACVESGLPPLQVLAADFLGRAPPERVAALRLPGFDMRDPRRRWPRLDAFLRSHPHRAQKAIARRLIDQFFDWDGFRPTPMMSREEVRQAAAEHEIGGHSFDHASMALETDDYLLGDVARCRRWIESVTGRPMRIYAFPNGSHRPGQAEKVRAAGVDHVLLAGGGFGSDDGICDRIGFTARSIQELRFRALGARARHG